MICLICRQAEIVDGLTSVTFERGEMKLVVNNVPARICPSCGETYVDEDVAVKLLRDAGEMSKAGVMDDVVEYDNNVTLSDSEGSLPELRDSHLHLRQVQVSVAKNAPSHRPDVFGRVT